MSGSAEELDEQLLETLRQSGLRLDREARWWHEGERVSHPRLAAALHRWLDQREDGRYIVRLDAQRYAYVEVEDVPYLVRSIAIESTAAEEVELRASLSDGSEEILEATSLRVGAHDALYCAVKGGRFPARLSRAAQLQLAPLLAESEGGVVLVLGRRQVWLEAAAT